MDEGVMGKLNSYGLRHVSKGVMELETLVRGGSTKERQEEEQREILRYLAASTNFLVQGRDEGFRNNIRGLQLMGFLGEDEAELALRIYDHPDPPNDLMLLATLLGTFTDRLPQFKENLKC
jgi:hypothetical protein